MDNARIYWKHAYRLMRIARRESRKAYIDMLIYGTGWIKIDENSIKHIPTSDLLDIAEYTLSESASGG